MSKNILFLGPVTNTDYGLVGGATISYGYLTEFFRRKGEAIRIVNTKRYFGVLSGLRNILYVLWKLMASVSWADVLFLNSSRGGTKYLAPLLYFMAKLFRIKFVFRPFGGDIKDYIESYSKLSSWIFRKTVLQADILYLQTNELIEHFKVGKQLVTSRKKADKKHIHNGDYQRRFVFLGAVTESKGIDLILAVAQQLDTSYTIHIYGPIIEERYNHMDTNHYKGVLSRDKVIETLSKYDVLLLPTHYQGEGYPGVIIEAFSLGIPVISTKWNAIPELVQHGKTGLLIEPRDKGQLADAMKSFDEGNFSIYSQNALQYFNDTFDEEKVLEKVRKEINEL